MGPAVLGEGALDLERSSVGLGRPLAREGGRRAAERLEVRSYPFAVARCGEEHLGTSPDSVHSLVYFYNWSFSHVRTGYALKCEDGSFRALRPAVAQFVEVDLGTVPVESSRGEVVGEVVLA